MPFTPSHAVVALAFVRTPLIPAAIAVGAMTPDLPLFVRAIVPAYGRTHDLAWLPLTLVWALALLLIWRVALRPATRELAPSALAARLPAEWDAGAAHGIRETLGVGRGRFSPTTLGLTLVSLAVGIVTHIAWDLFTHEGRGGVTLLPALAQMWGPLPGYRWLQHLSSALGLAGLAVWAGVWLTRRPVEPVRRLLPAAVRVSWWVSLPAILILAWVGGLAVAGSLSDEFTAAHLAYRVLPPACAAWGGASLLLAVLVQALRARQRA
ncbi:DUF4184 family protein [Microbacterium sp. RD1]|uniref:DUF4184 family protein n=1 Tax=Microbacterium sp. RD1 TaxID=3457313 RepID=UPI003FA526F6